LRFILFLQIIEEDNESASSEIDKI